MEPHAFLRHLYWLEYPIEINFLHWSSFKSRVKNTTGMYDSLGFIGNIQVTSTMYLCVGIYLQLVLLKSGKRCLYTKNLKKTMC